MYKLDPKLKPGANGNEEFEIQTGNSFYLFTLCGKDRGNVTEINWMQSNLLEQCCIKHFSMYIKDFKNYIHKATFFHMFKIWKRAEHYTSLVRFILFFSVCVIWLDLNSKHRWICLLN